MKFVVITHVNHIQESKDFFGYAPYVYEMNIWFKYVDEVIIVAPIKNGFSTEIDSVYKHKAINFNKIPNFNFINLKNTVSSVFKLPIIFWRIFNAMYKADHIHLRCPGNVGLIGCLVQVFFPKKTKTAKYAGNWDPTSKQPFTYRLQKWILKNTFLTHNINVLVYGEWNETSQNIKPFFTASYFENDKLPIKTLSFDGVIKFVFVGTLSKGKDPLYAIKIVENLFKKGYKVSLDLYGEGEERDNIEDYIESRKIGDYISLKGNQSKETLVNMYQNSHFVILPSKSEGWPKALAEGMFWGCIPIATAISCVPFMLNYGQRGILLEKKIELDTRHLEDILSNVENFNLMREKASEWSRKYTLDIFEFQIEKLLK